MLRAMHQLIEMDRAKAQQALDRNDISSFNLPLEQTPRGYEREKQHLEWLSTAIFNIDLTKKVEAAEPAVDKQKTDQAATGANPVMNMLNESAQKILQDVQAGIQKFMKEGENEHNAPVAVSEKQLTQLAPPTQGNASPKDSGMA